MKDPSKEHELSAFRRPYSKFAGPYHERHRDKAKLPGKTLCGDIEAMPMRQSQICPTIPSASGRARGQFATAFLKGHVTGAARKPFGASGKMERSMKYKDRAGIHPIHTGKHACSFCHRIFTSQESVRMHERSVHAKQIKKALEKLNQAKTESESKPMELL